ncbi:uncharacterized protein LOC143263988 [Megachile rotundata]|uniref:uncharacterized protein LOC143263988 n=1 Tax=Megachile rotundata TaxID=143995 RepID=UPI003FD1D985
MSREEVSAWKEEGRNSRERSVVRKTKSGEVSGVLRPRREKEKRDDQVHIRNVNKSPNIVPSASLSKLTVEDNDHINKIKRTEIKLAAFFAEHNIASEIIRHMVPLLKDICSDPRVVEDFKLSRRKCVRIIKNVLGKRETDKLVPILKNQKFSILIDKSTTIANDKLLCVLVKYVSPENGKCMTKLFELLPLNGLNYSAEKLYSAFEKSFKNKNIPISNVVGIACDNAAVMIGVKDSFVSRPQREQCETISHPV